MERSFETLDICAKKLESVELANLVHSLTKKFFTSESDVLDPVELYERSTEHNPNFWQEIQYRISKENLVLLVFDSAYRAWQIHDA